MPSCDGSNCGACNCSSHSIEYIHLNKTEKELYKKRIKQLEEEIESSIILNENIIKKLLSKD